MSGDCHVVDAGNESSDHFPQNPGNPGVGASPADARPTDDYPPPATTTEEASNAAEHISEDTAKD
ncbi:hypothetical protein V8E53_000700, partial [Lactarius tabidus]